MKKPFKIFALLLATMFIISAFAYGGLSALEGYNIREYRSKNPDGPYLDAAGNDACDMKSTGTKIIPNYQFSADETAYLAAVIDGNGKLTVDGKAGKITLDDDSYTFTLELDGVTYYGGFCIGTQNGKFVMTASAMSNTNQTVWAIKK